jgi:hypothetical protein
MDSFNYYANKERRLLDMKNENKFTGFFTMTVNRRKNNVFRLSPNINCKCWRNEPAQHNQYERDMLRSLGLLFEPARSDTFTPLQTVAELVQLKDPRELGVSTSM